MEPKVGIIITSWNNKEDTLECLRSVYRIEYPDIMVVVVDNGSTDGAADAISAEFPLVVLIRSAANMGFCAANNMGIQRAAADGVEYFLALNNDTVVVPGIVRKLRSVLEKNPDIGAVSPLIAYYDDPGRLQFNAVTIDWANGGMFGKYRDKRAIQDGTIKDSDFVTWCAIMFSRHVLDKVGLLDERYFAYYEDVDWSIRCRRAGFSVKILTAILVLHKVSRASGGEYAASVYYYLYRNRLFSCVNTRLCFARCSFVFCMSWIANAPARIFT